MLTYLRDMSKNEKINSGDIINLSSLDTTWFEKMRQDELFNLYCLISKCPVSGLVIGVKERLGIKLMTIMRGLECLS